MDFNFSEEDFIEDAETAGLLALGDGDGGEDTTGTCTIGDSIFRFKCISKPPTCDKNHIDQSYMKVKIH